MPYNDSDIQEIMETGERLPISMREAGMPQEILDRPIFDGSKVVEDGGTE